MQAKLQWGPDGLFQKRTVTSQQEAGEEERDKNGHENACAREVREENGTGRNG